MRKGFLVAVMVAGVFVVGAGWLLMVQWGLGEDEAEVVDQRGDGELELAGGPIVDEDVPAPAVEAAEVGDGSLIGGQRDGRGCLGPAGYSYDEEIGACVRPWELDEDKRVAAKLAIESIVSDKSKPITNEQEGITVVAVEVLRCPGCFEVELEMGKDRVRVEISDWEVVERSLTPEECEDRGGRTVNVVGGEGCEAGEENVGDVTGFISPNVCCVEGE